jgi:hypothetical protein
VLDSDVLHPEGLSGQGNGVQLVTRTGWPGLHGDAPLLAELADRNSAIDPTARRRHMESTRHRTPGVIDLQISANAPDGQAADPRQEKMAVRADFKLRIGDLLAST